MTILWNKRTTFVIPAKAGIQAERSEDLHRRQPLVIPAKAGTQAERSEDLRRRQPFVIPAQTLLSLRGKFLHSQKLGTARPRCDDSLELLLKWCKSVFSQDIIIQIFPTGILPYYQPYFPITIPLF